MSRYIPEGSMNPQMFQSVMESSDAKYMLAKVIIYHELRLKYDKIKFFSLIINRTLILLMFIVLSFQDMLAEIPIQVTEYMNERNFKPNIPDVSMAMKFQDMTLR